MCFFKGYYEIWGMSNKVMNRYEKDILITLLGYWKRARDEYHYQYMQMSYKQIMRAMGESDPHLIQKYISKLIDKDLLEILNIDDVIKNHHIPRFVLKEEKINVFFKTDIFNTTGKKENQPAGTASFSTTSNKKKETGNATQEKRGAEPDRKATLDYITNYGKKYNEFKQERNGIQEERRTSSNAEESAYIWD